MDLVILKVSSPRNTGATSNSKSVWFATDGSGTLTLDNGKYTCVIGGATYTGTYEEMTTGSGKLDGDIGGVYTITGNTMKVVITRPAGSSGTIEFTKK